MHELNGKLAVHVRQLDSNDAAVFQELRLDGLHAEPTAFASSYEEECDRSLPEVASRLVADNMGAVFGAFRDSELVGITGVRREEHSKLSHKAFLWGVFVNLESRQQGVGRKLVAAALDFGFKTLNVRQINLGVNAANVPAISLYESLGFKSFGLERGFLMVDGVLHDEIMMVCCVGGDTT